MVERVTAEEIHRQWVLAGSPPCDHPKRSPECDAGRPTGRVVCRRCGDAAMVTDPATTGRVHAVNGRNRSW